MIKCKICGSEISDGIKICPECSFRITPDSKKGRYCPSCFEKLSHTDESCPECGFTIPAVVHSTEYTDQYVRELAEEYSEKTILPSRKIKYLENVNGKYKKELDLKDEQLKNLQKNIDELDYELLIHRSKANESNAELEYIKSQLEERTRTADMLMDEINSMSAMLDELRSDAGSSEEVVALQNEMTSLMQRTQSAESKALLSQTRLHVTDGYAHVMENIVFCSLLCFNQTWAIEFPELRWPAYMCVGISVLVFLMSVHNIARCYRSHIADGVLPNIILGILWLGLLAGTFRPGVQYITAAVLLILTCIIGFTELFIFRSEYHHLWSEGFFLAMYTPTIAAACITFTYFMLCQAPSVAAIFGA